MIVDKITTHVQDALDQLLEQYKSRPLLAGLITAFVQQIQDLEDAIYPLDQYRQLLSSYGQQLDNLGQVIGLERNGLPDNEYLIFLIGTIAENNSDTTAPVLLYIIQTLFEATSVFKKDPNTPGQPTAPAQISFSVGSPQIDPSLYPEIEQIIENSIAAGVAIAYLSSFNAGGAFAFAGPQAWVKGFGAYSYAPDPTVGGPFGKLIFNNKSQ